MKSLTFVICTSSQNLMKGWASWWTVGTSKNLELLRMPSRSSEHRPTTQRYNTYVFFLWLSLLFFKQTWDSKTEHLRKQDLQVKNIYCTWYTAIYRYRYTLYSRLQWTEPLSSGGSLLSVFLSKGHGSTWFIDASPWQWALLHLSSTKLDVDMISFGDLDQSANWKTA